MNSVDLTPNAAPTLIVHDKPVASRPGESFWGSDAVALMLRELAVPYIALVPGASYRGLHDSIVNLLGNRAPQMVLCVHEETAVAIAHGYAKVTDKMMASGLHANIGLMRATMAIYNAWCDRAPILILGATGPWDATQRRPWIDWIHTTSDQGGLIRNFTKWDNQPGSAGAAIEALLRAAQIAQTAPKGPVYINLEVAMQEGKLGPMPNLPDPSRNAPPQSPQPSAELVAAAAKLLSNAESPVILAGRCSRSEAGWKARIALAEKLNAPVCTNIKLAAAFPTDHRLHAAPPGAYLTDEARAMVREADVILSLDTLDLAGTLKQAFGDKAVSAKIIQVSCDQHNHRGGGADHFGLPPMDVYLMCETDAAVPLLLDAVSARATPAQMPAATALKPAPDAVSLRGVGLALKQATKGIDVLLHALPARLERRLYAFSTPARLHRPRWRRGRRLWARHDGRRGPRVKRQWTNCGGSGRRRRFFDGQHGDLDRGALPDSVPDDRVQQPFVLQRRTPSRPHGRESWPPRRKPLDRPAY